MVKRYVWIDTTWQGSRGCLYVRRVAALISRREYSLESWRLHRG
jgi:hypothetical protein